MGGKSLARALQDTAFFPASFLHMLAAGEEVGKVAPMLERAAKLMEESVDQAVAMATATLQPLVMAMVGLWVGALVLSIMAPMVQIAQTL